MGRWTYRYVGAALLAAATGAALAPMSAADEVSRPGGCNEVHIGWKQMDRDTVRVHWWYKACEAGRGRTLEWYVWEPGTDNILDGGTKECWSERLKCQHYEKVRDPSGYERWTAHGTYWWGSDMIDDTGDQWTT